MGFDLDSCCVGYDGKRVVCLPRAMRALNMKYNMCDITRRSLTYESRLYKYAKRGFAVAVPHLRRECIDPKIYDLPLINPSFFNQLDGLKRLLLLEKIITEKENSCCRFTKNKLADEFYTYWISPQYDCKRIKEAQEKNELTWRLILLHSNFSIPKEFNSQHDISLELQQIRKEQGMKDDGKSDYLNIRLPFARGWDVQRVYGHLQSMLERRENILHMQDLEIEALKEYDEDYEYDNLYYTKFIDRKSLESNDHVRFGFTLIEVLENIKWVTHDPGRQIIGSFHPLSAEGWAKEVHLEYKKTYCTITFSGCANQNLIDSTNEHVIELLNLMRNTLNISSIPNTHRNWFSSTQCKWFKTGTIFRQACETRVADEFKKKVAKLPIFADIIFKYDYYTIDVNGKCCDIELLPEEKSLSHNTFDSKQAIQSSDAIGWLEWDLNNCLIHKNANNSESALLNDGERTDSQIDRGNNNDIYINDSVNRLRGDTLRVCAFCQRSLLVANRCKACGKVSYCNQSCQRNDWKKHRLVCNYKKKKKN